MARKSLILTILLLLCGMHCGNGLRAQVVYVSENAITHQLQDIYRPEKPAPQACSATIFVNEYAIFSHKSGLLHGEIVFLGAEAKTATSGPKQIKSLPERPLYARSDLHRSSFLRSPLCPQNPFMIQGMAAKQAILPGGFSVKKNVHENKDNPAVLLQIYRYQNPALYNQLLAAHYLETYSQPAFHPTLHNLPPPRA